MEENVAVVAVLWRRGPLSPGGSEKINGLKLFCHSLQRGHSSSASINQALKSKVLCFDFWVTCSPFVSPVRVFPLLGWCSLQRDLASQWRVDLCLRSFTAAGNKGNLEISLRRAPQPAFSQFWMFGQVWMKLWLMAPHEERIRCNPRKQWCVLLWPAIVVVRTLKRSQRGFRSWLNGKPLSASVSQNCKMRWPCLPRKYVAKV